MLLRFSPTSQCDVLLTFPCSCLWLRWSLLGRKIYWQRTPHFQDSIFLQGFCIISQLHTSKIKKKKGFGEHATQHHFWGGDTSRAQWRPLHRKRVSVFRFLSGRLWLADVKEVTHRWQGWSISCRTENLTFLITGVVFCSFFFFFLMYLINYFFFWLVAHGAAFLSSNNASRVLHGDIIVGLRYKFTAISRKLVPGCSLMRPSQSSLNHCLPFPLFANSA